MDNYETGIYTDNHDDTLRYMKSAEVVEVVRCKDCKHWKRMDNLPEHYGECLDSVFGYWYCAPREDFFCKNGERRSE